ncbi:UNKNOWN [Stylonychia lemnae]|uniref:RAP domain-containing protein n=1 Tax=Stylonychia lemnae TaxID=5949 RepID=A0A078AS90_STYLE|nr:UNKNOWN [Stylonychia lemnae]|eukprot:CDW85049.1 UNKNOWN [Stylonychia lemnae]
MNQNLRRNLGKFEKFIEPHQFGSSLLFKSKEETEKLFHQYQSLLTEGKQPEITTNSDHKLLDMFFVARIAQQSKQHGEAIFSFIDQTIKSQPKFDLGNAKENFSYARIWQTLTNQRQIAKNDIFLKLIEVGEMQLSKIQADNLAMIMNSLLQMLENQGNQLSESNIRILKEFYSKVKTNFEHKIANSPAEKLQFVIYSILRNLSTSKMTARESQFFQPLSKECVYKIIEAVELCFQDSKLFYKIDSVFFLKRLQNELSPEIISLIDQMVGNTKTIKEDIFLLQTNQILRFIEILNPSQYIKFIKLTEQQIGNQVIPKLYLSEISYFLTLMDKNIPRHKKQIIQIERIQNKIQQRIFTLLDKQEQRHDNANLAQLLKSLSKLEILNERVNFALQNCIIMNLQSNSNLGPHDILYILKAFEEEPKSMEKDLFIFIENIIIKQLEEKNITKPSQFFGLMLQTLRLGHFKQELYLKFLDEIATVYLQDDLKFMDLNIANNILFSYSLLYSSNNMRKTDIDIKAQDHLLKRCFEIIRDKEFNIFSINPLNIYKALVYLSHHKILNQELTDIYDKIQQYFEQYRKTNPIKTDFFQQKQVFQIAKKIFGDDLQYEMECSIDEREVFYVDFWNKNSKVVIDFRGNQHYLFGDTSKHVYHEDLRNKIIQIFGNKCKVLNIRQYTAMVIDDQKEALVKELFS